MFNRKLISFLQEQLANTQDELRQVRQSCEEKVIQERIRCETEIRLSRVREQGLIDRFLLKNGVPQIYNSVETEQPLSSDPIQGLPPGARSIQYYQNLEDKMWNDNPEAQLADEVAKAKQNILSEIIDE
jgi:hypothetical protein